MAGSKLMMPALFTAMASTTAANLGAGACQAVVPIRPASGSGEATGVREDVRLFPHRSLEFAVAGADGQEQITSLHIRQLPGCCLGAGVWSASIELVRYLLSASPNSIRGKAVLELGSGTGSTAIALAKMLEPATMVATDQNDELINLIHENAQANAVASHSSCTRRGVASRRCASSAANSAQLTRLP
jgi:predicted nicotinamide N-methyase